MQAGGSANHELARIDTAPGRGALGCEVGFKHKE